MCSGMWVIKHAADTRYEPGIVYSQLDYLVVARPNK